MIVMVSTDDLLCFYNDSITFHGILVHTRNFFLSTPQLIPVPKFINLRIAQSKNDIIFDQTSHIKNTNNADIWFPNPAYPIGTLTLKSTQSNNKNLSK